MQTVFQYEAAGSQPALIFETNIARAATVYLDPASVPAGVRETYVKTRLPHKPGPYLHANKALTPFEEIAAGMESGKLQGTQKIVEDDRAAGNFIYGYESNLPKLNLADRGHFHTDSAEHWMILSGQIRYRIEGFDVFVAEPGDIVYVTRYRWHLARWFGDKPACRFAMNGFPNLAHFYDPEIAVPSNVPLKK
jgi:mannose-6-phosphate isomerase-like protein (cupin superfamily)